ncbi:response regulator transcription factor [Aureimonas populi]|uniref:Response regulator transcription factor n=1 Tax=Aureimonas populi TaxID=1701758 RepID=A0ABW5CSZ8_9HYPH|nr:response regulator [Aureimonas populi]
MILPAEKPRRVVFVIEDDKAVRRSLEFVLDLEGYAVESFADGGEVLRRSGVEGCGCLIVDFKLPDCDGLTLIDRLRRYRAAMPAILITSGPRAEVRGRAAAMGVVVIEKPFLENQLMDEVNRLLGAA